MLLTHKKKCPLSVSTGYDLGKPTKSDSGPPSHNQAEQVLDLDHNVHGRYLVLKLKMLKRGARKMALW